jgi:CBS domain-containing protein
VFTCQAADTLQSVARQITTANVGALAVMDGEELAGIISG